MKKKNRTWRAAALLLALTLVTSCFVGGTFAKYTTSAVKEDTARVAKWGVTISADTDLFAEAYKNEKVEVTDTTATVKLETNATAGTKLVAPGTEGTGLGITNSNDSVPEVSYTMTIKLGDDAKVPTLKYTPSTTGATQQTYEPVKFSVYNGTTMIKENMNLAALEELFDGNKAFYKYDVSANKYYVDINGDGTIGANEGESEIAPEIIIKWEWAFEAAASATDAEKTLTDMLDTILGNKTAGVDSQLPETIGTIAADSVITDVELNWTATATQVD